MSAQVLASSGSTNVKARAPRPFRAAVSIVLRFVQASHMGGWGFCTRLGQHVATRHGEALALVAGVRLHHHHVGDLLGGLERQRLLALGRHAVAVQLEPRRALTDPEVDAASRDQVEHGHGLGRARRVVVVRDHLANAERDPDPLGLGRERSSGTPRTPSSASTPPGSGARRPTRSRSRSGPRSGPARWPPGSSEAPTGRPMASAAAARRTPQIASLLSPSVSYRHHILSAVCKLEPLVRTGAMRQLSVG